MEHKQSPLISFLWMNVLKALLIIMVVQSAISDPNAEPPGDMMIELFWTDGKDCDLDLYVKGPDGKVMYNNRSTASMNLLRDDLGNRSDTTSRNYEVVYTRGIVPGKYTVAAHLFSADCELPLDVEFNVSSRTDTTDKMHSLYHRSVKMIKAGQEITMVNFELAKDSFFVPGSENEVQNNIATVP